jgi:hypothetical protein
MDVNVSKTYFFKFNFLKKILTREIKVIKKNEMDVNISKTYIFFEFNF